MDIKDLGVILRPTGLEFENKAVLNPGCVTVDGITHMYYRAVRQGNFSTIGYCRLRGTVVEERWTRPLLVPEHDFEMHGLEDPRIILLDGVYYLFYTAYDGKNVRTAYATGSDPLHFVKQGLISPGLAYEEALQLLPHMPFLEKYLWYGKHYEEVIAKDVFLWEKDTFIFPRKINGKFLLMPRVMPGIQVAAFDNFSDLTEQWWKDFLAGINRHILLEPRFWFETRKIGPGCPPIETPEGWLFIYHGVEDTPNGNVYRAAAALLDSNNPAKILARLPEPLFSPVEGWEKIGDEPNIVFPTGASVDGDRLTIFYGAADSCIGAKELSMGELLRELKQHGI